MSDIAIRYYSRDIGLQRDRKFRRLRLKYGYWAIAVYEILLDLIYADKGYYIVYNDNTKEDVIYDIYNDLQGKYQQSAETVEEIISGLVDSGLFSVCHFKLGYLTSHRIQEFFYRYTVERKNVKVDPNIWLLTVDEMKAISVRSSILSFFENQPNLIKNRSESDEIQPKNTTKESKGNKSKGKEIKNTSSSEPCSDGKGSEPQSAKEKPVILLPLNTKEEYPIYQADVDEWSKLYPSINVMQELRNMKGWLQDNPRKRKTQNGIRSFIGRWLREEQKKVSASKDKPSPGKNFKNFEEREYDAEELNNLALELIKGENEECQN